MGPRPPDWDFLQSLTPGNLEEDDAEKVKMMNQTMTMYMFKIFSRFSSNFASGPQRMMIVT